MSRPRSNPDYLGYKTNFYDWLDERNAYIFSLNPVSNNHSQLTKTLKNESSRKIGIVLDLTCQDADQIFRDCSAEFLFTINNVWLLYSDSYQESLSLLRTGNLSFDSDVGLLIPNDTSSYLLYDIYKVHYSTEPVVTLLYSIEDDNFISLNPAPVRDNLMGFEMPVVFMLFDVTLKPNETYDQLWDLTFHYYSHPIVRYTLPLFSAFKDAVNVSYRYILTHEWGIDDGTGKWTGMIGALQHGGAEFSLHIGKIRKDRLEVMDNVVTLNVARSRFVFLQPKTFGSYKALVTPMNPEVWYSLAGFVLLFLLIFTVISNFDESVDFTSFADVLLLTLGTFAQQDFNDTKMFSSSRMACFTLLLLSFTACLYYNAAVLNGLLSPTPNTIRTLEDLLDSNMKLGVVDTPYMKDFYADEGVYGYRDGITKRLISKIQSENDIFYSFIQGISKVTEGHFAFFHDEGASMRHIIRIFSDSDICLSYFIDKNVFQNALALRNDSPYKELLARKFTWMLENGLRKRAVDKWLLKLPECQWRQEALSIGIEAVTVAFITLFIGIALSIIILIFEITSFKKIMRRINIKKLKR